MTMLPRLRKWSGQLGEAFWPIPSLLILLGILAAINLVRLDRIELLPSWLLNNSWTYDGGPTGARTLLGAIAASTIGVAGTVFSITIAALSFAAGQMGPRLLRNFTRDRGVQVALGIFLGTFSYALMVLRTVRTQEEIAFTPHLSLSVSVLLAFVCVVTLVYFVSHMASRINVDTVIELVSDDLRSAIRSLTTDTPGPVAPEESFWRNSCVVYDTRRGYLQELDLEGLADWAAENATTIRLLKRPGDYIFPGAPIAILAKPAEGVEAAIQSATALGPTRASSIDLEFAIRQLVEVATRALSPGVNDPFTAISVLDRLGAALCDLVPLYLPTGVQLRDGRVALVVPHIDYDGASNAMFHMIRQSASGNVSVLIRILEVIGAIASCEQDASRRISLKRHADLVLSDAERDISNASDLSDLRGQYERTTIQRR